MLLLARPQGGHRSTGYSGEQSMEPSNGR